MPKGHLGCRMVSFSFFFFSLEKGKEGYTLSLEEVEVCQEEKDKIMHKSCPCALGNPKIVLAGGSTGQGRLHPEKWVWVWTLTRLLCRFRGMWNSSWVNVTVNIISMQMKMI